MHGGSHVLPPPLLDQAMSSACVPACFRLSSVARSRPQHSGRAQGAGSSSSCRGCAGLGSVPQCRLVLRCPQAGSGWERRCMESGREMRLSQGKGAPTRVPGTPLLRRPCPSDPLQSHLSWICRSRCCCAAISRLCCCTWPVSTHTMWLCLSAWACGVRTETSAGADAPPFPWLCPGLSTPQLHLCDLTNHCCSVASTSPSVKWG